MDEDPRSSASPYEEGRIAGLHQAATLMREQSRRLRRGELMKSLTIRQRHTLARYFWQLAHEAEQLK